jgi:hypothetical protein
MRSSRRRAGTARHHPRCVEEGRPEAPRIDGNTALYNHQLNTPSATSRVWDAIYESEGFTAIPPEFATFSPAACFKPATTAVQ